MKSPKKLLWGKCEVCAYRMGKRRYLEGPVTCDVCHAEKLMIAQRESKKDQEAV